MNLNEILEAGSNSVDAVKDNLGICDDDRVAKLTEGIELMWSYGSPRNLDEFRIYVRLQVEQMRHCIHAARKADDWKTADRLETFQKKIYQYGKLNDVDLDGFVEVITELRSRVTNVFLIDDVNIRPMNRYKNKGGRKGFGKNKKKKR